MTSSPTNESTLAKSSSNLLLVIFIHGFKGSDNTFKEFPRRLQHVLSESIDDICVESIVFPAYETKGELNAAVTRFSEWLATLTVQRENHNGGGAGSAQIVLCGHSMGGFLAADTLLELIRTQPSRDYPLWPRIIACVTFDTPFLGINPNVVKNGVTRAAGYFNAASAAGSAIFGSFAGRKIQKVAQAQTSSNDSAPTSSWGIPAAFTVGGALLAAAATAGGAYYKRDDLSQGYTWLMDHMKYAGNVWDESGLRRRVDALVDAHESYGILFHNFYVLLPEAPPTHLSTRTFIVQPKRTSREMENFTPARNKQAADEVQGHTGMFDGRTNDGYYNLGLTTANVIRKAIQKVDTSKLNGASEKDHV